MTHKPFRPQRRSIRLANFDYSQAGAYFVTINVNHRVPMFGKIVAGCIELSRIGEIVRESWNSIPIRFRTVRLDEYVFMPDHMHGIVILMSIQPERNVEGRKLPFANLNKETSFQCQPSRFSPGGTQSRSLGSVIQTFKSSSSRKVNNMLKTPGFSLWQRNYYEHIIRSEADLIRIRKYIRNNPINRS